MTGKTKGEEPDPIQDIRKNVDEWDKELKKVLRSWGAGLAYRVRALKAGAEEEARNLKTQNEKGESDGYTDTTEQSADEDDLLGYGNTTRDETKTNTHSGRKRHNKHERTK